VHVVGDEHGRRNGRNWDRKETLMAYECPKMAKLATQQKQLYDLHRPMENTPIESTML
jgi:hypothetical protein